MRPVTKMIMKMCQIWMQPSHTSVQTVFSMFIVSTPNPRPFTFTRSVLNMVHFLHPWRLRVPQAYWGWWNLLYVECRLPGFLLDNLALSANTCSLPPVTFPPCQRVQPEKCNLPYFYFLTRIILNVVKLSSIAIHEAPSNLRAQVSSKVPNLTKDSRTSNWRSTQLSLPLDGQCCQMSDYHQQQLFRSSET